MYSTITAHNQHTTSHNSTIDIYPDCLQTAQDARREASNYMVMIMDVLIISIVTAFKAMIIIVDMMLGTDIYYNMQTGWGDGQEAPRWRVGCGVLSRFNPFPSLGFFQKVT